MSIFGKLDPEKQSKTVYGMQGTKQRVKISHEPNSIPAGQNLYVDIPNMAENKVMIPASLKLLFNIELTGKNAKRTICNNLGKALISTIKIRLNEKEIQSIHDYSVFSVYKDLWLSKKERTNRLQGLDDDGTINSIRVGTSGVTGTVEQKATAKAFGKTFCVPLGSMFEFLSDLPLYKNQNGFRHSLRFELHFADHGTVLLDSGTPAVGSVAKIEPDSTYKISDMCLEFDQVESEELAAAMTSRYYQLALPFERISMQRMEVLKKGDTHWNIRCDTPSKSFKGALLLFVDPEQRKQYASEVEKYYNPGIKSVKITLETNSNELFSDKMLPRDMYDFAKDFFGDADSDVSDGEFFTSKYCLWVDFRSVADNNLHGSGRRLVNLSNGITLAIEKSTDSQSGPVNCYIYLLQDAQINISNGRILDVGGVEY